MTLYAPFREGHPFNELADKLRRDVSRLVFEMQIEPRYRALEPDSRVEVVMAGLTTALIGNCFAMIHENAREPFLDLIKDYLSQAAISAPRFFPTTNPGPHPMTADANVQAMKPIRATEAMIAAACVAYSAALGNRYPSLVGTAGTMIAYADMAIAIQAALSALPPARVDEAMVEQVRSMLTRLTPTGARYAPL